MAKAAQRETGGGFRIGQLLGNHPVAKVFVAVLSVVFLSAGSFVLTKGISWGMAAFNATGRPRLDDYMQSGLWWALSIDAVLALGLAVTWWVWCFRPRKPAPGDRPAPVGKVFWLGLILVLVLGAALRLPRMDLSLYNDEASVFFRYISGRFALPDLEAGEVPAFKEVSWKETLWRNKVGNNHVPQTVLSRLCYEAWSSVTGAAPGEINEWALRLPSLVGGLAAIGALVMLGRELGFPMRGWLAGVLLALSPWHVTFSTEARGYSLMMAFYCLGLWFLACGLKREQWRWWLGLAVCEGLALCCFLGSVYLAAALSGVVFLWLVWRIWRAGPGEERRRAGNSLRGLVVANVLALMLLLAVMGPAVLEVSDALKVEGLLDLGIPPDWWPDVLGLITLGMPWVDGDVENPFNPAVLKYWPGLPLMVGFLGGAVLLVGGLVALVRADARARLFLLAALVAVTGMYAASLVTGNLLLKWYACYLIPFVPFLLGLGGEWLYARLKAAIGEGGARLVTYGVVVFYAVGLMLPLRLYRITSKQPLRDSVELARGAVYPDYDLQTRKVMTVGWLHDANLYDPAMCVISEAEEMRRAIRLAQEKGDALYAIYGKYSGLKEAKPELAKLLEDRKVFEEPVILYGLTERQYRIYVFKLREAPDLGKSAGL